MRDVCFLSICGSYIYIQVELVMQGEEMHGHGIKEKLVVMVG